MRKIMIAMLATGGMAAFGASSSSAWPVNANAVAGATAETSLLEQVAVYHINRTSRRYYVRGNLGRNACHNRHNSRFRAGRCHRGRW